MTKWLNKLQPWGVLLLRLVLGWAMLYNGWDKVVPKGGFHGHNTFAAVDYFSKFVVSLGMPYWLGAVSAFTEVAGGLCLIFGLFTRLFAFLIAINMLVCSHHSQRTSRLYRLSLHALPYCHGPHGSTRRSRYTRRRPQARVQLENTQRKE